MIRELIDLQHRLQEAENLIVRLEDQLQHLIDREHLVHREHHSESPVENPHVTSSDVIRPDNRPQYSYGARYADVGVKVSGTVEAAAEPRDAAYCVGREGSYENYRRPF